MIKNLRNKPIDARHLIVSSILLLFLIPLLAAAYLKIRTPQIEQEIFRNLEAIAKLQSGKIEEWLRTQKSNIGFLTRSHFQDFMKPATVRDNAPSPLSEERRHLKHFRKSFNYEYAGVFNNRYEEILSEGALPWKPEETKTLLGNAFVNDRIDSGRIFLTKTNKTLMIFTAPLGVKNETNGKFAGILVAAADLDHHLFQWLRQIKAATAS